MLSMGCSKPHRYTKPARFMSKTAKRAQLSMDRASCGSFSFSGRFDTLESSQPYSPVSRSSRTAPMPVYNGYEHRPAVCSQGVRRGHAFAMLLSLALVLLAVWGVYNSGCNAVNQTIIGRRTAQENLQKDCTELNSQIDRMETEVNVRLMARQLGMVSSRDAQVTWLQAPADAYITFDEGPAITALANIWGQ